MNKKNIVWADDEISQLKPHIMFLEKKGYNIIPVNSGEDAIEKCEEESVDLLLVDEMMMGLDGLSTIKIIKKKCPDIPIIMITKNEEEWLMDEAIGFHIANYLTKPVNPSQVFIACKNILENKKIITDKALKDFIEYFNELSNNNNELENINDWFDLYNNLCSWEIRLDSIDDKNILNMLDSQKQILNQKFNKFILGNYKSWIDSSHSNISPVLSHNVFESTLKPILSQNKKLIFIIIDCLRLDQWKVISEVLYPNFNIKEGYHVSIIPSATPFARNSIFSGLLPNDLKLKYPEIWKEMFYGNKLNGFEEQLFNNLLTTYKMKNLSHKYVKISDLENGKKFLNKISDYENTDILSIVVNFVDILGHSRSESKVLSELIPNNAAYRQAILNWFNNSWLLESLNIIKEWDNTNIVITSDHGNTNINKPLMVKGDQATSQGIRYKYGRNLRVDTKHALKITNPEEYNLPMFDVNTEYIVAKDKSYFVYRNEYHKYVNLYKNTFQHGGISLDEMLVPLVQLNPKK